MNRAAFLTALAVILLVATTAYGQSRYSGNGHYYEAVSSTVSWTSARDAAAQKTYSGMTGHLVTVTSSDENEFLRTTVLGGLSGSWWIGGYQPANSSEPAGNWKWVTGETWSWTNWNSGEPNNSGGEDVAEMYTGNGYWNDNKSSATRNYIVEYEPFWGLAINSGDEATNSSDVTLTLTFESGDDAGTPQVRFRNDGGSWSGWSTYATSMSWTMGTDQGTRKVEVEFQDAYGYSYLAEDTISLDSTPPSGTVAIEGGAEWTNATVASLSLTFYDAHSAVAFMRFRNSGEEWGDWVAAATSTTFELTAGEGVRSVDAQFRDHAGNVSSTVSDSIQVDQTPPEVELTAAGGEAYTQLRDLPLTITATDDASGVDVMRFRERGYGYDWGDWMPYSSSHTHLVRNTDGEKVVEVQVRDRAGNITEDESNTVTLDRAAPDFSYFRINGGDPYVMPGVELEFEIWGSDGPEGSGVQGFKASYDNGVSWSDWYALLGSFVTKVERPAADGLVDVRVVIRDGVGHESTGQTVKVYLVEEDLPVATGGGKLTGTLYPREDVDALAVDLVKGDLLDVKVNGKATTREELLLAVDLVLSDGQALHLGRYPDDAKTAMIKKYVAPKTDRYYVLLRIDPQSKASQASHSLIVKVKQSKTGKKGKGTSTGEAIQIEAAQGSLLKATLKGQGLTAADLTLTGPDGPVAFTAKEGNGSVKIDAVLDAGTGTYTIAVGPAVEVAWKWKLKLPKKVKTAISD